MDIPFCTNCIYCRNRAEKEHLVCKVDGLEHGPRHCCIKHIWVRGMITTHYRSSLKKFRKGVAEAIS